MHSPRPNHTAVKSRRTCYLTYQVIQHVLPIHWEPGRRIFSNFNEWTQLASVIAICGYLETYIAQIATAALESRPALIFGGTDQVDGTTLLKAGNKYDFYDHVEPLIRGDWQSRISAYARLFGSCPFEHELTRLEQVRNLRNNAGHTFGRDIKSMRFVESSLVQPLPKASEKKIQGFLGLADSVASKIEKTSRSNICRIL